MTPPKVRDEKEIISLILQAATTDGRIRAVFLNGSRANPNISKDRFQDFDIVYMVTEIDTFLRDQSWIDIFGERLILQMPGQMELYNIQNESAVLSYLMLFEDCNRIDLTLYTVDKIEEFIVDSLTVCLLDKDKLFSNLPAPNDADYLIERPTQKLFADCCNEFWWVSTYVVKGLWRREIIYAKEMLENPVRKMFLQLIEWHIGVETGFTIPFGKNGRYMQANLSPALYAKIIATYPGADAENIWKSLFMMCDIFSDLAKNIVKNLALEYSTDEEYNVLKYLQWVYSLTKEK